LLAYVLFIGDVGFLLLAILTYISSLYQVFSPSVFFWVRVKFMLQCCFEESQVGSQVHVHACLSLQLQRSFA